jgi:PKD repeat protein
VDYVKEKTLQITVVVLFVICISIGSIGIKTASESVSPVISLDPPISTAAPGETFSVNITATNIAISETPPVSKGLYSWEVKISFNPDIVNVTSVTRGPFLRDAVSPEGYTTAFSQKIDNIMGVVDVGESVFPKGPPDPKYPPVGATGNGTLATITFQAKTVGATLLHFEEDRHFLFTVISDTPVEITHQVIDGTFDNREPSTININASPSTIKPSQTITITGSINPTKIGVNVTIQYRQGGTLDWINLTTVLTNETSQYSYDWTPTTLLGTYELISSWEGDATTSGAESDPIAVVIGFQPPIALFSVDPVEPLAGETVTLNATESKDPDGYIVNYAWDFGDNITGTGNVTTHSYTAAGTYIVTLTVTDDDNENDTATADVTVLGHNIAIISVVPSPTTVKTGESVSISVSVTNEGNFTETFNVTTYYADTSIETQTDITLTTGNSTTLTFNWNTADIAAGDYTIKAVASRVENETDLGDNTRIDGTVTIEKQSSQITISVDPSSITVGKNTTISGTITPTRAGATVTIQYRPTEGDWSVLETVTTDTNGQYVYTWSSETAGTYEVKAEWEGDATHLGAESNADSVTIREAAIVDIYLFAVAGIGIVIAVALALYFLRARKKRAPKI